MRGACAAGALALAALTACIDTTQYLPDDYDEHACEQVIYGACVVYDRGARPIPGVRLKKMFEAAAQHWGTKPDVVAGWTVVVKGRDPYDLGGEWVWGTTLYNMRRLDFATPMAKCPEAVFVHEWGHAGADVRGHDDERFDENAILEALKLMGVRGCQV